MRILLFDPFHGAAGDMITGALLDAGADEAPVRRAMASVVADPEITRVKRCGVSAIKINTHAGPAHRTPDEVLAILSNADAAPEAVALATEVYGRIKNAEETIHGSHAHFHEVGADDAIADVIGACTAIIQLAPDAVAIKPVCLGSGTIESAHGTYPVPAPATLAILKEAGLPVHFGSEESELCTPTGAALLATFAAAFPGYDEKNTILTIQGIGHGAGTRDPPDTPNVIRVLLAKTEEPDISAEGQIALLETNVDDVTPEVIAYTIERLMENGARDASAMPIVMKKGRSGHLIRVVCTPGTSATLTGILISELGTLGVRSLPSVHRSTIKRSFEEVSITIGTENYLIPIKVGWLEGKIVSLKAEFEDASRCARTTGMPLRTVSRLVEEEGWKSVPGWENAWK